jgi:hypothetical protein
MESATARDSCDRASAIDNFDHLTLGDAVEDATRYAPNFIELDGNTRDGLRHLQRFDAGDELAPANDQEGGTVSQASKVIPSMAAKLTQADAS